MKAALMAAALLMPAPAAAQTISVQAGEHATFTRLVLDLPQPTDWQLGRTADGYELRVAGGAPRFDLTKVFRVIPRTRLASIWADPASGTLRIGIACACHAVPFEFRPDIIVIDLRDGPPDVGSTFEAGLDGGVLPTLTVQPVSQLRPRPAPNRPAPVPPAANRWATVRPLAKPVLPGDPFSAMPPDAPPAGTRASDRIDFAANTLPRLIELPAPVASPGVDAMRAALLEQFGRAATAGVIDIDTPVFPAVEASGAAPPLVARPGPYAHLAIDGVPGLAARPANTDRGALTDQGAPCLPDTSFDLSAWADNRPFDAQMAGARARLLGEFDRPDPERVADLVRLHLYFGFGAEARNVLSVFPLDDPDAALWGSMADIVDDRTPPAEGPLADQAACTGRAALWVSLAHPILTASDAPDRASVTGGFSALPVHLRRHLGPALAEKFLAVGDVATAQAIRDAIWRAPGDAGPGAQLIDAHLALERGNVAEATETLADVAGQNGPVAVRALIDLVDARLTLREAVDPGTITALAALAREHRGGPFAPALIRAEMLARGSAGDFDAAFRIANSGAVAANDLWQLLARVGPDSALLTYAVLPAGSALPMIEPAARLQIGDRLLTLGFADAALLWLPSGTDSASLLRVARAELQRGDARAALRRIAGRTGPEIDLVRAGALAQLGDQGSAATAFGSAGDTEAQVAALWRAQDWTASATTGSLPRRAALEALSPAAAPPSGNAEAPLAQGRALLQDSARAREAILALLQATPAPATAQP